MSGEPSLLPYWPVPIPKGPIYDSSTHKCEYCDALEVAVGSDAKISEPFGSTGWMWTVNIPYAPQRVVEAAAAGCMFFVWVTYQLRYKNPKLAAEYPLIMQDDPKNEPDCPLWLVFRFVMSAQGPRPSPEGIIPSKIDCVDFSLRTKTHRWDHLITAARSSRYGDRIEGFQAKKLGVESCLYGNIASPQILLQVRDRLADCFQYHEECHRNSISRSAVRPTRFLDVDPSKSHRSVSLRTLDVDNRRPYVTLSYVWGQDQVTKTTMATRARHESGIAIDSLPATIRDAILVTRLIGVDFLWVDSLCIVQDDPDELAAEIASMASYYGNSLVTLSVAAAPSCVVGFLEEGRAPQPLDWIQFEIPFVTSSMTRLRLPLQPIPGPRAHALDWRAWALQETLLSKRLVTIGPQATSWSCPTVTYGDITFKALRRDLKNLKRGGPSQQDSALTNTLSGKRWETHDPVAGLDSVRQLLGSPCLISGPNREGLGELTRWHRVEPSLLVWFRIVYLYCMMYLSDQLDILNAISGIAQQLSTSFSDNPCGQDAPKYLAGLWWTDYFPMELLWVPLYQLPSRGSRRKCTRPTLYTAPSWSWASIRIPYVMERLPLNLDSRCFRHINLISCYVKRRNPRAPYGSVTDGHLVLKGRVIQITTETFWLIAAYRIMFYGDTEDITTADLENSNRVFTLLEILTEEAIDDLGFGPGIKRRGLILERNGDRSYRRVGIFGHQSETGLEQPRGEDLERELRWRDHLFGIPWETEVLKIL